MKKIFKEKPHLQCKAGEFDFRFYYKENKPKRCCLRIGDEGSTISMRIAGNTEAYGYLFAAARQNRTDQLQGYATLLYVVASAMTGDQRLADDITEAVGLWMERRMAEGAKLAEEVTEGRETAEQVFMEDVAGYADAKTDREREEMLKKWTDEIKEEIGNEGETENP